MFNTLLEVKDIDERLHEIYEREEIMFSQRSRLGWLKVEDRNTSYFQNRTSHQKHKQYGSCASGE